MNDVLMLLTVHFVGDFLLQTDWMAVNKSKRWDALTLHAGVYAACFAWWGWQFVLATFVLHWLTDVVTSRVTSRLWFFRRVPGIYEPASYTVGSRGPTLVNPWLPEGGNRHWFFVVIGFDQLIHAYCLAGTLGWVR